MKRAFAFPVLTVLLLAAAASCSSQKPAPAEGVQGENGTAAPASPATTSPAAAQSLAGRWMLVLTVHLDPREPRRDLYAGLLEVQRDESGRYSARLLKSLDENPQAELRDVTIGQDEVAFALDLFGGPMQFEGTQREGVVYGTVLRSSVFVEPARLVRTQEESLAGYSEPQDPPGLKELEQVLGGSDRLGGFQKFVQQRPDSPLALDAQQQLLFAAKERRLSRAEVEQEVAQLRGLSERWGPRMVAMNALNSALILAQIRYLPELALEHLQALEASLTDADPRGWKELIATGRSKAAVALAVERIERGTADQQAEAIEQLTAELHQDAFNHLALYTLARYAETHDRLDEAIGWYGRLAALPRLDVLMEYELSEEHPETPSIRETLEKLWERKHGSTDGLEEHLTEVYRREIYGFVKEGSAAAQAERGNRVTLCELFTGAQCPPCMAADVAVGGLDKLYGPTEAIVLRYHQHVPGPDPLTNEHSEARMHYYSPPGTPATFVNGEYVAGVAGPLLSDVRRSFERLKSAVDPQLARTTDLKITLSAQARDGKMFLSARVDGWDQAEEKLRLRMALAESEILYVASNQIRLHNMVVRHMPGGPDGLPPQDGRFEYAGSVDLAEFKQSLVDYLAEFEENTAQVFRHKPLDLQHLHFVAFVQDDQTQEVLQAAQTAVEGPLEYPADIKPTLKPQGSVPSQSGGAGVPPATGGPALVPPRVEGEK